MTAKENAKAGGAPKPARKVSRGAKGGNGDVGKALRSAYDQTLTEVIPNEMLDLLSKLS